MSWIKGVLDEILGLFVDDGSFAIAILAWVAAAGLLMPRLGIPSSWCGAILFVSLALILVDSVLRRARR